MKGAVQILRHQQQQLTTWLWIPSLLLNAQHTTGPGFAAECKAQYHLRHTVEVVCANMH